jgi:hypothetical protein
MASSRRRYFSAQAQDAQSGVAEVTHDDLRWADGILGDAHPLRQHDGAPGQQPEAETYDE